jgi:hypothetical protein
MREKRTRKGRRVFGANRDEEMESEKVQNEHA